MNEYNNEHDELIGDLQALGRRLEGETFPGAAWKPRRKSRFKTIIAAASIAAAVLLAVALTGHLDKGQQKENRKQAAETNNKIEDKTPAPVAHQTAAVVNFRPVEKAKDLQVSLMSLLSNTKKAIEQIPLKMPSLDFTGKDKPEKKNLEDGENIRGNSCAGGRLRRFA